MTVNSTHYSCHRFPVKNRKDAEMNRVRANPNVLLLATAAAATTAAIMWWQASQKEEDEQPTHESSQTDDKTEDAELQKQMQQFMQQDLENRMIEWKKLNMHRCSFENFLRDEFPENIKVDGDCVIWVDERVQGPHWKGAFQRVKASDASVELGPLPGTTQQ